MIYVAREVKSATADKYNSTSQSGTSRTSNTIQGSNAWWYRSFFQYDLSELPTNAEISRAVMRVYCVSQNDYAKNGTTNIKRITKDWDEGTVSWNTQPEFDNGIAWLSENVNPPAVGTWGEWDITSLVRAWVDGTYENYGVYVSCNNEGGYRYNWDAANRRYSDGNYGTRIEIEYTLKRYHPHGEAIYRANLSRIKSYKSSIITWEADTPSGTSLSISAGFDGAGYQQCYNRGPIGIFDDSQDYHSQTLFVKVSLDTSNELFSPELKNLHILIRDNNDNKVISLILKDGNLNGIGNAIGDVEVSYFSTGVLAGDGGPVEPFNVSFTPQDLQWKSHQNDVEHIEMDVRASGNLIKIRYTDMYEPEHINMSVKVVGTLTNIKDL